jgi:hypothetical protein
MIAGGNWWRANEIVIRHLSPHTKLRYLGVTKPSSPIGRSEDDVLVRSRAYDGVA